MWVKVAVAAVCSIVVAAYVVTRDDTTEPDPDQAAATSSSAPAVPPTSVGVTTTRSPDATATTALATTSTTQERDTESITPSGTTTTGTTTTSTSTTSDTFTPTPRDPISVDKDVIDYEFPQGTFTVQQGDTVVWTHRGSAPHSVTENLDEWDSSPECPGVPSDCLESGETFSHTFDQVGSFDYYCKIHPDMYGTVTVVAYA